MAPTRSPEAKTTSRANRSLRTRAGFTLVEILLVLGIIAMVMSLGLPAISRVTMQRLNSTTRQFVGLIRTVRNDAVLLNTVHRLAIDFEKKTYWVEQQKKFEMLSENPDPSAQGKGKGKGEPPPSNFAIADKYSKEPKPFPGGVECTGLFKEKEGLRAEGLAYVHFFPNGFNDSAILYLAKEGSPETAYSLVIRPTSGRVDIYREIVKSLDAVNR